MDGNAQNPGLQDARVWLVTDGTAEAQGWQAGLISALSKAGASTVDVLGVSGVLSLTARGLIEQGADKLARTLRLSKRGEPESDAVDALKRGRPDIVLVDHPGVLKTLEIVRDTARIRSVHVGIVSDYEAADEWIGARADAFVAPDEQQLQSIRRPGMSDEAFRVAGPPIPAGFARTLERAKLRRDFGFADDMKVVFVDVSTMSPMLIDRAVFQLSVSQGNFVPIFYYGRNIEAAETLRQVASAHGLKAQMFGHVDALEEYVVVADVVYVGPDSPMVAAYLAQHRPVLAVDEKLGNSLPDREGAVVVLFDATVVAEVTSRIARDGIAPTHAEGAARVGRPEANDDVAAAIAAIWDARHRLRSRQSSAPAERSSDDAKGRSARFESIGEPSSVTPQMTPLSRAAAKEQLAALILEERRVENEVSGLAGQRDKWLNRLPLAEEAGAEDLIRVARTNIDRLTEELARLNGRLRGIQEQKDVVRRRASIGGGRSAPAQSADAPPTGSDMERRFRELERRNDMDRLRRRADES